MKETKRIIKLNSQIKPDFYTLKPVENERMFDLLKSTENSILIEKKKSPTRKIKKQNKTKQI